jgi:hypothetical protein
LASAVAVAELVPDNAKLVPAPVDAGEMLPDAENTLELGTKIRSRK